MPKRERDDRVVRERKAAVPYTSTETTLRGASPALAKRAQVPDAKRPIKQAAPDFDSKGQSTKKPWSQEEDDLVSRLIAEYGLQRWRHIASFVRGRSGKQVRERWRNQLDPNLNKDGFTEHEDRTIVEAWLKYGNQWSEIARMLKGRTDNAIKNYWNSAAGKKMREQFFGAGYMSVQPAVTAPFKNAKKSILAKYAAQKKDQERREKAQQAGSHVSPAQDSISTPPNNSPSPTMVPSASSPQSCPTTPQPNAPNKLNKRAGSGGAASRGGSSGSKVSAMGRQQGGAARRGSASAAKHHHPASDTRVLSAFCNASNTPASAAHQWHAGHLRGQSALCLQPDPATADVGEGIVGVPGMQGPNITASNSYADGVIDEISWMCPSEPSNVGRDGPAAGMLQRQDSSVVDGDYAKRGMPYMPDAAPHFVLPPSTQQHGMGMEPVKYQLMPSGPPAKRPRHLYYYGGDGNGSHMARGGSPYELHNKGFMHQQQPVAMGLNLPHGMHHMHQQHQYASSNAPTVSRQPSFQFAPEPA
eukprot:CAMPEP_0173436212 /NCGR_PEP_ID=MMETSP1357-20121228/15822_1 /TAXON_ID=77926 /ORGANISM="Hemiselmis rufescens, Strain PCC563" /LENGTH=528 /DNA_ID=CAMNT_0014401273 /DNA_START=92 /DNA_END=1675 /DNA_ORIENTATION=+